MPPSALLFLATFVYAFWLGHFISRQRGDSQAHCRGDRRKQPAISSTRPTSTSPIGESPGVCGHDRRPRTTGRGRTLHDGNFGTSAVRDLENTVQTMRMRLATHYEALETALARLNDSHPCSADDEEKIAAAVEQVLAPARQISQQCLLGYDELRQKTITVSGANPKRTDHVTGLNNEYALAEWLRMMFALMSRYGHAFSMVIVNVEQGLSGRDRTAAHELLLEVGQLLKNTVRETDLVFRMNGAQFALVLPETNLNGADVFACRLHSAINAQLQLPAAIGVSPARADDNLRSLNDRLAAAIFAGNSNGGNRVYRHTGQHIEEVDPQRERLNSAECCAR